MKRNKSLSVASSQVSRSKGNMPLLTEAECNLLLSRIAGELGINDARSLPYTAALTAHK